MQQKVKNFFLWIRENLNLLILIALIAGAIKGYFSPMEFSRVICGVAMLTMVYPIMIYLKIEDSLAEFKKYTRILFISFFINFLISPIIAILIVSLFLKKNIYLAIGLLLIGSIPTSGLTLNWIHRFKGNIKMGILLVFFNILFATILVPFFLPIVSHLILQSDLKINSWIILEKIIFIIIVPILLGYFTRLYFRKINKTEILQNNKDLISGISNLGILLVMFLIMSLENTKNVLPTLMESILAIPAVFIYYFSMFLVYKFLIKKNLREEETIPLFLSTFLRYHIISLGIAISAFGETTSGILVTAPIILGILIQPTAISLFGKYIFSLTGDSIPKETNESKTSLTKIQT
ncbi:MAG: arsenic resistance protein [Leptonema sp. (in: bacteria)]